MIGLSPLKIKDALPIGGDKHGCRRTDVLLPQEVNEHDRMPDHYVFILAHIKMEVKSPLQPNFYPVAKPK